ncbi:amino acid permease [Reyranella soli]|uniref:Amino acid transporter n=1 Tax=Reyranella soli TaxID=1230389 RepID=A0A512NAZ0_9HYPH|nr:amino acid permease [Reyranella soli]GEP56111.1 amino acid transporter [Reyranella soli]
MDHKGVFARKPVADIIASEGGAFKALPKVLGPFSIVAMGVGAIIGAGIFVLTGTAAALYAGPALTISFVLAAVACGLVGLCYAELSTLLPVQGSTYTYTYATLGELAAWMIGWDLILEYSMGVGAVACGWSAYFNSLLVQMGLGLPPDLLSATGERIVRADGSAGTAIADVPAAVIVLVITGLLIGGTRESVKLNNAMVVVKLVVVLAFVLIGAAHVNTANWQPYIPPNTGEFGQFGISGVLRGASIVFFAYIGFDAVSNCAQEARQPQRDMPIGILGSLALSTVLYIAVAAVLTGLVPYPKLNVADPVVEGARAIGLPWLSLLIEVGALLGLTTVILVLLYGQSRIFATIANDGLLPPVFARIHPRFGTPWISQLIIGIGVAIVAATMPIDTLSELVGAGTLFAFVLVCIAVIYLRRAEPNTPRPFRTPWVPWLPLGGILACLGLLAGLGVYTWVRVGLWIAVGLVIYFAYGRFQSRLRAK